MQRLLQGELPDTLLVHQDGHTAQITFNDPARHNAVSFDMWQGLTTALNALEREASVRSVVLCGAGIKAFVSGANISQFDKLRTSQADIQAYEQVSERAQMTLRHFSKPTIAKIRGYCIGGGMGIALCCDIRIASESGIFGIPAGRLGLGYRLSAMNSLVRTAGSAAALDIFLSARKFSASQALCRNLVHYVVPEEELDAFTQAYLNDVNANAPLSLSLGKDMIRALDAMPASVDEQAMTARVLECYQSEDYQEGKAAFKEKRPAQFKGR